MYKLIQDIEIPLPIKFVILILLIGGPLLGLYLKILQWWDRPQKYTKMKDRVSILESLGPIIEDSSNSVKWKIQNKLGSTIEDPSNSVKWKIQSELESILRFTLYETQISKEAFELLVPIEQRGIISAHTLKKSLAHQKLKKGKIVFFHRFDWIALFYYRLSMFTLLCSAFYCMLVTIIQIINGQEWGNPLALLTFVFILAIMQTLTFGSIVHARKTQKSLEIHEMDLK